MATCGPSVIWKAPWPSLSSPRYEMPRMIVHAALKPRKVAYPGASGYRDPALADAVCAGCFSHLGITLDLGPEPDWLTAEFPADKEWRREWSKFGYARTLAQAFGETNDARY